MHRLTTAIFVLTVFLTCIAAESQADFNATAMLAEANESFRRAELWEGDGKGREAHYGRAERLATAVLAREPDHAEAHFLIFAVRGRRAMADGVSLSEAWQLPQLNRHLDRTLELDPNHASALAAKGGLLLDLPSMMGGNPQRSIAYLRRALELNPDGLGTRITLARALIKANRKAEARTLLLGAAHRAVLQRDHQHLREAERLLTATSSRANGPAEASNARCFRTACGS
jgi:tetratricopeptide (TPR) repeat protein